MITPIPAEVLKIMIKKEEIPGAFGYARGYVIL